MIQIANKIDIIEIDGRDVETSNPEILEVKNHWNSDRLVVFVVGGKSYTLSAGELRAAITNATNTAKY